MYIVVTWDESMDDKKDQDEERIIVWDAIRIVLHKYLDTKDVKAAGNQKDLYTMNLFIM